MEAARIHINLAKDPRPTKAARKVLADCSYALSKHSDDLGFEMFRVSWISIVTLLRAVGHVLDKVDGERSSSAAGAIGSWWYALNKTKPEPAIFWKFIEQERNLIIKEYKIGVERWAGPPQTAGSLNPAVCVTNLRSGELEPAYRSTHSYLSSGPFAGRHEREVAKLGIAWWQEQLDTIDSEAVRAAD